jgi:alpha-glucosidase
MTYTQDPLPNWLASIHHDCSLRYLSPSQPKIGDTITLLLRAAAIAPIRRVFLRVEPDGEQQFLPLHICRQENDITWWQVEVPASEPVFHYRFLFDSPEGFFWFNAAGFMQAEPLDALDFKYLIGYHQPAWLSDAVLYQIFPDTFANGDPSNDPQPSDYEYRGRHPKMYAWSSLPPLEECNGANFFGGDLAGIQDHLDYLQTLGVNCLFLNPIFDSYSNHKYDVNDFYRVDRHFGGNAVLERLSTALHARGMHILLDITPNHTSRFHDWFIHAQNDPHSIEADFYTFHDGPEEYESWLGHKNLPKLNYQSEELRRRMFTNSDAVFRYWLLSPYNIDGYRVDVGNMMARQGESQLNREIGREMRQAVKSVNPDAYILGENFFDASGQLQGDMWDGDMNYSGFTFPLLHWLAGASFQSWNLEEPILDPHPFPTQALVTTWQDHLAAVPWQVALQHYNLIGSHDVRRIIDRLGYNPQLLRLAIAVQFTFPGLPGIYYGDEAGLRDVPGLGMRTCMEWDQTKWDQDLFAFYQKMTGLRRSSHALQSGGFKVLAAEEDVLVYQRETAEERWIVQAVRSQSGNSAVKISICDANLSNGMIFTDVISGKTVQCCDGYLSLPDIPQGVAIWQSKS